VIDRRLFTVDRLLDAMLDSRGGNIDCWRRYAEIQPLMDGYEVVFQGAAGPSCLVEVEGALIWDLEGTIYRTAEQALLALLRAPIPPWLIRIELLPSEHNGG